jgi:hypothetical protein
MSVSDTLELEVSGPKGRSTFAGNRYDVLAAAVAFEILPGKKL